MVSILLLLVACGQCEPRADRELEETVRRAWLTDPTHRKSGAGDVPAIKVPGPAEGSRLFYDYELPPRSLLVEPRLRSVIGPDRPVVGREDRSAEFAREVGRAEVLLAWVESTSSPETAEALREVRRLLRELADRPFRSDTGESLLTLRALNIALLGMLEVQLGSQNNGTLTRSVREFVGDARRGW